MPDEIKKVIYINEPFFELSGNITLSEKYGKTEISFKTNILDMDEEQIRSTAYSYLLALKEEAEKVSPEHVKGKEKVKAKNE